MIKFYFSSVASILTRSDKLQQLKKVAEWSQFIIPSEKQQKQVRVLQYPTNSNSYHECFNIYIKEAVCSLGEEILTQNFYV